MRVAKEHGRSRTRLATTGTVRTAPGPWDALRGCVLAAACGTGLWAAPGAASAGAPQPLRALQALVDLPLALAGDTAAAAGLIGAAGLGLAGDALGALDANRATEPLLHGRIHGAVQRLAWALSAAGTGSFEALQGVDVERWPEPAAAYLVADPGVGRLDTALGGLAALALIPWDAAGGIARVGLHACGAESLAARVEGSLRGARSAYVGPPPAAPAPRGALE